MRFGGEGLLDTKCEFHFFILFQYKNIFTSIKNYRFVIEMRAEVHLHYCYPILTKTGYVLKCLKFPKN
jgi:hypothetical protein